MLVEKIDLLRSAFEYTKQRCPFRMDAVVILPDHLYCIWTLPQADADFSTRWNLLKGYFSRHIANGERISVSRKSRRERGIWQRRFWEHLLRDQNDFNRHVDYIHWNPVKHGLESAGLEANLLRQWDNGSYFLNFSLHSLAMRLKIEKICTHYPTWLATIA